MQYGLPGSGAWERWRRPSGWTGALFLALGPFLVLSGSFALPVARVFITGAGHGFVGALVFCVMAVKRCARFRGTLIGSLRDKDVQSSSLDGQQRAG